MKPTLSTEASAALAELPKKWPELTKDVDKAKALHSVRNLHVSTHDLAKALGCSATLVRNLLQAAKAPVADRILARKGEISTRELVRRSKQVEKQTKAKDLEALDKKRTKLAQKGARVINTWLRSNVGYDAVREGIVDETRLILAKNKRSGTLPNPGPPASGTPVDIIIERTRPPRSLNPDTESPAWYADWLARWAFFAFPDEVVRDRALNIALDVEIRM